MSKKEMKESIVKLKRDNTWLRDRVNEFRKELGYTENYSGIWSYWDRPKISAMEMISKLYEHLGLGVELIEDKRFIEVIKIKPSEDPTK